MVPLVLFVAAVIAVGLVSALSLPWWAGVVIFLIASPAVAAGIAFVARQTGQTSRILRASGPPPGSPGYAVHEAFVEYAEANRQADYERAAQVWDVLRATATAASASDVLKAMDAVEKSSGANFDERSAKAAIHRLRLAIDGL
jgi:phosphate/sulfate permease